MDSWLVKTFSIFFSYPDVIDHQKNAKTALSVVYDDKSALEKMHCTLLMHAMRYHGLGSLLDRPEHGPRFRKLLLETVLATDMSVHFEFMARLTALVDGDDTLSIQLRRVLMCQALIKCADISNPVGPSSVSRCGCLIFVSRVVLTACPSTGPPPWGKSGPARRIWKSTCGYPRPFRYRTILSPRRAPRSVSSSRSRNHSWI